MKRIIWMLPIFLLLSCTKEEIPNKSDPSNAKPAERIEDYWWPVQNEPRQVVIMSDNGSPEERMLTQSLIGVAAQCVNQGLSDEMIYTDRGNKLHKKIFMQMKSDIGFSIKANDNVWRVLERYYKEGKVTGYVLYKYEPEQCVYAKNPDISESANSATMLCGLKRGVLIDETLAPKAASLGIPMIADARNLSPEDCFEQNKEKFNKLFTFMADPHHPAGRDLVIAQRATMIHKPEQKHYKAIVQWLEPLAPVLGVTCADEAKTICTSAEWGHFHLGMDHSDNFVFFSAGAWKRNIEKQKAFDPRSVDLTSDETYHSVFVSDGDNMGWVHDIINNQKQWQSSDKTSLSWTFCPTMMSFASPYGWNYFARTKKDNCSLIEYGQYFMPDVFATKTGERNGLLKKMAKTLDKQMEKTGTTILSFLCLDSHSPAVYEAAEIFAKEIRNLTGIIAIQYYPYPDGKGEVTWFKNNAGIDIPMVRPKYCIVAGEQPAGFADFQGTPSQIMDWVNTDRNKLTMTVYHAWSSFNGEADGLMTNAPSQYPKGTLEATSWASKRLKPDAHLVSAEEVIWRIRMKERPEQTKKLLGI